jgi:hypothetical protein
MLSEFVIAQIVFDVAVVAAAVVYVLTRPGAPRPPEPPEWYAQFLKLAQDLMTATEPVLERLETRAPPPPVPLAPVAPVAPVAAFAPVVAPAPARAYDRYEEARALLRSGAAPDTVAGRVGLQPGEIRLLAKVVAAESRRGSR